MLRFLMCKSQLVRLDVVQYLILVLLTHRNIKLLFVVVDELLDVDVVCLWSL